MNTRKYFLLVFVFFSLIIFSNEVYATSATTTAVSEGSATSLGDYKNIFDSFRKAIDNALDEKKENSSGNTGLALYGILYSLCGMVFIWQMSSIAIKNLLRVGEFSWDEFRKPGLLLLILAGWGVLDNFVRSTLSPAIAGYVEQEQLGFVNKQDKLLADFDIMQKKLDEFNSEKQSKTDEDSKWYDFTGLKEIAIRIKYLDEFLILSVITGILKLMSLFDLILYLGFDMIAKVWLKIVGMGGAIALTVSAFTGGWSPLINWAKTYVSVSLWLPVSAYIVNLVNMILVSVMTSIYDVNAVNNMTANEIFAFQTNMSMLLLLATQSLGIVLWGLIVKLILLGKVPNMISGWISGGGSASGGFSAAFVPLSAGKQVAGAVASKGTSLLK